MTDLPIVLKILGRNESKRALREVRTDLGAVSNQLRGLRREALALAGITIGIGGLVDATRKTTDFRKALAEVSTLLDDSTQIDGLRKSVERLSRAYGGDVITNTQALYNIISAGASDAAEATNLLEQANRLALGGVTDVATAADGLTSILNAYGPAVGEAADVSDALFVAMRAGKTTIGELSASIGQVAPLASNAGVSLEQLLAATAAITKGGVRTAEAMTQVRSVLAAVVKPSAEAVKLAGELGIEFNVAAIRAKGFASFLEDVRERTGGSEAALSKLFGRIEALQGVLALTGAGAEDFNAVLASMDEKAGQTAIAVDKLFDDPAAKAARFAAAVAELERAIGDVFVQFAPLLEGATDLVEVLSGAEDGIGGLITQLGTMALVLGAGRLTGALTLYSAAQVKAAIDARRLALSTLDSLRAKEADALSARAAAVANLNMARAMDQATGGLARQAAAAQQVAAAHAAYTAAANASASASRNLSLTAAAGRGALTLLGGPIGAITTALLLGVTAWSAYGDEAQAAAVDLETFTDVADRLLGNLNAINRRQIESAIDLGESSIAAIEQRIRVVTAALQSTRDEARAVELRRELVELQQREIDQGDQLAALRTRLASLGVDQREASGGTGVATRVSEENDQIKSLIDERDRLLKDLKRIDESLTAGPDPAEQSASSNILRLNTLRGQIDESIKSKDPAAALRGLQEAKSVIEALAKSGEASSQYLQAQIGLVSELANAINSEDITPKTDRNEAAQSLQDYATLRDQFLMQNPGKTQVHVDEADSLARLQSFIAIMQAEASKNAITIPVSTGSTQSGDIPGKATGGPIIGPGPKGRDSILMYGAPGEHMITSSEVDAVGGHGMIYRLRAAMRSGLIRKLLSSGRIPGFANGGPIVPNLPSLSPPVFSSSPATSGAPMTFVLDGRQVTVDAIGDGVDQLYRMLRREQMKRGSRT